MGFPAVAGILPSAVLFLSAPACWAPNMSPSPLSGAVWSAGWQSTPVGRSALGLLAGMMGEGSWACGTRSLCSGHLSPTRRWANASPS